MDLCKVLSTIHLTVKVFMLLVIWISVAFVLGSLARFVGLPPLVGYLLAGFGLHTLNPLIGIPPETGHALQEIAHMGVLLLMFGIGLKLRAGSLIKTEILGVGSLHFLFSVGFYFPVAWLMFDLSLIHSVLLACGLSFSSTVLAAKILDEKRELRAFHGRVAIGILILQDVIALLIMTFMTGNLPSPWALLILLLPFLRPVFYRLMDFSGHGELLVLLGLFCALVCGGYGFEWVGLSSELGALVFGLLLSQHKRAVELSGILWSVKEIFLVGFFLQIGSKGLPNTQEWLFALVVCLLIPLKMLLYFLLMTFAKLRARSAFLSSLTLGNYSEFGLIMASLLLPDMLTALALALSLSFIISAPLNRFSHLLYERHSGWLNRFERQTHHPDEQPVSLGDATVLVFGMGRTGTAAYEYLQQKNIQVVGLDSDPTKVEILKQQNFNIEFADAEDPLFWQGLDMGEVSAVILSMSDLESKMIAARKLRKRGFTGKIVSHSLYPEEAEKINLAGADTTYLTMSQAGVGLAEHLLN
jgi:predicted Kef-type K+ transport protein